MSNITVLFYGNDQTVGRCQMILDCLPITTQLISNRPKTHFFSFIFRLIKAIFTSHKMIVLNRKSCFFITIFYPLILIKRLISGLDLIYDMWEFYTFKEHTSVKSRLGTIFEAFIVKRADKVIVCNKYRARLVKLFYKVEHISVIENFRILPSTLDSIDRNIIEKLLHLNDDALHFLITNGFSSQRNDQILLDCFSAHKGVTLTFMGSSTQSDSLLLEELKHEFDFTNIHFIESVPYKVLAKVIALFDCGVVNYSVKNLNNKYCASGKIYEFLALGLPVITSNNPSLKSILSKRAWGLSTSNFKDSLTYFISNHRLYKENLSKNDFATLYAKHRKKAINLLT